MYSTYVYTHVDIYTYTNIHVYIHSIHINKYSLHPTYSTYMFYSVPTYDSLKSVKICVCK